MASWKAALAAMKPRPSSGRIDASRSMAAWRAAMCSGLRFCAPMAAIGGSVRMLASISSR